MKLKLYETIARYLLGAIYLFGAVDGALQIFFHVSYTGEPDQYSFTWVLQRTPYFWSFMKLCELIGAFSLLMNYKPALGLAIVAPITAIICLVYAFEFHWYVHLCLIGLSSLVLFRAYFNSFRPLLAEYS